MEVVVYLFAHNTQNIVRLPLLPIGACQEPTLNVTLFKIFFLSAIIYFTFAYFSNTFT